MKSNEHHHSHRAISWKATFIRWVVAVAAFAGLGASCQVCPFCGQPGCIGGGIGSALIGAITATITTLGIHWKHFVEWFRMRFRKH